jgi:adenine phosphoribosyltransferase
MDEVMDDGKWMMDYIESSPNFPKNGIVFYSAAPLLENPMARKRLREDFQRRYKDHQIDGIVGVSSRGFVWGALLAEALNLPLLLACKKGKIPPPVVQCRYTLEYGEDCLEMKKTDAHQGENWVIVDDVLATGGTAKAVVTLVEALGVNVQEILVVLAISDLPGREVLRDYSVVALLEV